MTENHYHSCCYCGSEIQLKNCYCDFCEIQLDKSDIQINGNRKKIVSSFIPGVSTLKNSTVELLKYSTIELVYLLRMARKERSEAYGLRFSIVKGIEQSGDNKEFKELVKGGEQQLYEDYEYWSRKCFVLENIIRERTAFYPASITDQYISKLLHHAERSERKPMQLSTGRKVEY
ncbi:hypothetical protein GFV16_00090 [Bacillus megaterium]|uniref:hypothetical protein n=1 Tax=Priestia megaterium TaxID=1404 RepID=UPI001292D2A5|nr:hypothetical protein [Priestia megaterium]MQR84343.1 hypothetical protein [Priestia megaterium]